MKTIELVANGVNEQAQALGSHVKKYHRSYLFGIFSGAVVIKLLFLLFAGVSVVRYGVLHPIHASELIDFEPIYDAETDTAYMSPLGEVLGVGSGGVEFSVTNAEYLLNNTGSWSTSSGMVVEGDIIRLRVMSSHEYSTATTGTLTIGTQSADFVVNTRAYVDTDPSEVIFEEVENAELSTMYISEEGVISDINTGIMITGVFAEYSINSGPWLSGSTMVYDGDTFRMRMLSSDQYDTETLGLLKMGALDVHFFVYTKPEFSFDDEIDYISFDAVNNAEPNMEYESNAQSILGINTGVSVWVDSGVLYSINGAGYTGSIGELFSGDLLQLKQLSSPSYATTVSGALHVGEVQEFYFLITTMDDPTLADTGVVDTGVVDTGTNLDLTGTIDTGTNLDYTGDVDTGTNLDLTGTIDTGNNVVLDEDSPVLTSIIFAVDSEVDGYFGPSTVMTVAFDSDEELYNTEVKVNDIALIASGSTGLSYVFSGVADTTMTEGPLLYVIDFEDEAGNTGQINASGAYIYDKTNPVLSGIYYSLNLSTLKFALETDEKVSANLIYSGGYNSGVWMTGLIVASDYEDDHELLLSGLSDNGYYVFALELEDRAGNSNLYSGAFEISSGVITFDVPGVSMMPIVVTAAKSTVSLLKAFKTELLKYHQCKAKLNIQEIEVDIQGSDYEIDVPNFNSSFLSNISNIFSKLVVNTIDEQGLSADQIDEILTRYNNFLVVLKLLRDNDVECQQNLSNYHITNFQSVLQKYKVFEN